MNVKKIFGKWRNKMSGEYPNSFEVNTLNEAKLVLKLDEHKKDSNKYVIDFKRSSPFLVNLLKNDESFFDVRSAKILTKCNGPFLDYILETIKEGERFGLKNSFDNLSGLFDQSIDKGLISDFTLEQLKKLGTNPSYVITRICQAVVEEEKSFENSLKKYGGLCSEDEIVIIDLYKISRKEFEDKISGGNRKQKVDEINEATKWYRNKPYTGRRFMELDQKLEEYRKLIKKCTGIISIPEEFSEHPDFKIIQKNQIWNELSRTVFEKLVFSYGYMVNQLNYYEIAETYAEEQTKRFETFEKMMKEIINNSYSMALINPERMDKDNRNGEDNRKFTQQQSTANTKKIII